MWLAKYLNGEILSNEDSSFVDLDESKLIEFRIIVNNKEYTCNCREGFFKLDTQKVYFKNLKDSRIIYFKKIRQNIGTAGKSSTETEYCIGLRKLINTKNYQIILSVSDKLIFFDK